MVFTARLFTFSRGYATRPSGSRLKPTLSLDQFIQRGRVLAFYRTILRGTKKIVDPTTKAESRRYARDEFERRRNVTDASHVRYLLSVGKTEWEGMERYIDGM
ncbi:LYR motif-containing protein [Fusarium heterosporum]|uniref:LYR motif-containing protein 2 n=1 Tax=Fusarium heterosporum TaxID=42747 RepID=A0A8H5WMB7_FUSHE|nr:LYR motif-containing protein [Fusarium heterosporum]